jgi:hypothetical protein
MHRRKPARAARRRQYWEPTTYVARGPAWRRLGRWLVRAVPWTRDPNPPPDKPPRKDPR